MHNRVSCISCLNSRIGTQLRPLSDALVYAEHAGRPNKVEMEDATLAVQARVGWEFGGRVPKEVGVTFRAAIIYYI